MFDLSGKKALVTGASGGIGGAIAKALHAQGADVALSGTREDALKTLADELGERAHVTPARLGEEGAAEQLIADATEAMGGVDILINNAGLGNSGPFLSREAGFYYGQMQLNMVSLVMAASNET